MEFPELTTKSSLKLWYCIFSPKWVSFVLYVDNVWEAPNQTFRGFFLSILLNLGYYVFFDGVGDVFTHIWLCACLFILLFFSLSLPIYFFKLLLSLCMWGNVCLCERVNLLRWIFMVLKKVLLNFMIYSFFEIHCVVMNWPMLLSHCKHSFVYLNHHPLRTQPGCQ